MRKQIETYGLLVVGSALLAFMGWRWNVPFAVWIAPVLLMRFFRSRARWAATLVALPVMTLPLFASLTGSWDFSILQEVAISLFRALLLAIPLWADRSLAPKLRPVVASLVYPATYVVLDFAVGLTPLGTVFSAGATQFSVTPLIQLTAITGIWGLSFMIGWFASVANLVWEHGFALKQAGAPLAILAACLGAVLLLGGLRLSAAEPAAQSVSVAGVIVPQQRDYYAEIIDLGTPAEVAHGFAPELADLQEDLFTQSERAADSGAEIIFWSEGNSLLYPEDEAAFIERARTFAQQRSVYFVPAYVAFRYDEATADNKLLMITPTGELAYEYTKTKSWYPTDSDGIIHAIDTEFGTLSAVICFDMDFPAFMRQAARQNVDIMLVPSFDWEPIKPYHTQVGLLRGIENGFSVVRHVNEGTSIAIDYQGNVLAYQDYFDTADHLLLVDMPIEGTSTLYGLLGDWLVYASGLFVAGAVASVTLRPQVRSRAGDLQPQPQP